MCTPDESCLVVAPVPCRGLHSLTPGAGHSLVLFGGAPKSGPMLGDLWALRGLQGGEPHQAAPPLRWEEVDPEGRAPHVRCSQGAASVGSDTFFCGGSYYK